jgi:hypothetical protein
MFASSLARRLAVVFVAALMLAGCANRFEPVYNVQAHPVMQPNLTADQVRKAIVAASASVATIQKWSIEQNGTGALKARVTWSNQKFAANADIRYTGREFSIVLVDAANLWGKNEHAGQIRRNYNLAVQALEEEIDRQLQAAATNS